MHIFSIDFEDWYQGNAVVSHEEKLKYPPRLLECYEHLKSILNLSQTRATIFVLGHVARENKKIIKELYDNGHEIASHGFSHRLIYNQRKNEFKAEALESKHILEDIISAPVMGYRASNWSITDKSLWALDILKEIGFEYDSSVYGVNNYLYGIKDAPSKPYYHSNGLYEIPPCYLKLGALNIPYAGGFYIRALPKWLINSIYQIKKDDYNMTYIHPWELDTDPPKGLPLTRLEKFIHYYGIKTSRTKLDMILNKYKHKSIMMSIDDLKKQYYSIVNLGE